MSKNKREGVSKSIPVKLNEELLKKIQALSKTMGEPQSTVMRMAMRIGLPILEKTFKGSSVDAKTMAAAYNEEARYPAKNLSGSLLNDQPKKSTAE